MLHTSELVFVRWGKPIRYYVKGLSRQERGIFNAQSQVIADYTGLDIAPHEAMYLEYKDESRNNRADWPDGRPTNVVVIFGGDTDLLFKDPDVDKVYKGLNMDPKIEYWELKRYEGIAKWSGLVLYRLVSEWDIIEFGLTREPFLRLLVKR